MNTTKTILTEIDYKGAITEWLLSDEPSLAMSFENVLAKLPIVAIKVPDYRFSNIDDIMLLTPDEPMYNMEEYGFWDKKKKEFLLCINSTWTLPETIYQVQPFNAKDFAQVQKELLETFKTRLKKELPQRNSDYSFIENTKIKYITKFPSEKTAIDVESVIQYWQGDQEAALTHLNNEFKTGKLTIHGFYAGET